MTGKCMNVEPATVIIDIIANHRATEKIFKKYDTVGDRCVLCQTLFQTVEDFARMCNLDLEKFIGELNGVIRGER